MIVIVVLISSSLYTIDDKDNHDDGALQCTLEQEAHFIFCKF